MLHRMTVTGQRIVSPLSDPINRMVISGAEVDGDDSHPNEPDPMPAPIASFIFCDFEDCDQPPLRDTAFCARHTEPDDIYIFDWHTAYSSKEFDSLEHPQPRIIEWTDGKDERPAHITLAEWDAPFNGNTWEPGQVRGRQ